MQNSGQCGKRVVYEKCGLTPEVYSGVPTFLGVSGITADEIGDRDVVIMGAPWEGVCTTGAFTGTELAVKSIRTASLRYGGYLPEFDFDFFDVLKLGDLGDSPTFNGDTDKTFEAIESKVYEIHSRGKKSVCFGGDHSISIPTLRALARLGKKIGVVHFDAHLDNLGAFQGEEKEARCTPLHHAYEIPEVEKVVHIGIRGPRNHPSGLRIAKENGARVIMAAELHRRGWEDVAEEVKNLIWKHVDLVYVTICSDALDVSTNPGGPADFGGLTSHQLLRMVHDFASEGIAAFDYVEVYPPQDLNSISSHLAAWAAIYAINGMGKHALAAR